MRLAPALLFLAALAIPRPAMAQVTAAADSGDTGWMILCALLLMVAALPGSMLRHAGSVNVRSALSVLAQGGAAIGCVSLAWAAVGYSLAYAPGNAWLGGGSNLLHDIFEAEYDDIASSLGKTEHEMFGEDAQALFAENEAILRERRAYDYESEVVDQQQRAHALVTRVNSVSTSDARQYIVGSMTDVSTLKLPLCC